jgi:hypothetical protein
MCRGNRSRRSTSFSPPIPVVRPPHGSAIRGRGGIAGTAAAPAAASGTAMALLSAMERLHDPSTNAYGRMEHVYPPREVGEITEKISDDEWTALGSVIAKTMLKTTLDVGDGALRRRGWVKRMTVTNRIAEEVLSAM